MTAKGSWPLAIIAAAAAVLATVGLLIYELEFATLLENYACVSATWVMIFVLTAVTRRRSHALLWVYAGPLILTSWQIVSTQADEHRWRSRHDLIPLAGRFIFVAAIACMATGLVIGIRSGQLPLRRIVRRLTGASQKDSADPPAT